MSTIAAISTGRAPGGIGVIRISGENAINVADKVFSSFNGKRLDQIPGYSALYGKAFDKNGDTAIQIFKTIADPFVGKLSYFKVYSGTMTPDTTVYNPNKEKNERVGKIFTLIGKKQTEVEKLSAGDIGAVAKLAYTETGDTLCSLSDHVILEGIDFDILAEKYIEKANENGGRDNITVVVMKG